MNETVATSRASSVSSVTGTSSHASVDGSLEIITAQTTPSSQGFSGTERDACLLHENAPSNSLETASDSQGEQKHEDVQQPGETNVKNNENTPKPTYRANEETGVVDGTDQEPPRTDEIPAASNARRMRPRLMEANDELWGSSAENQDKREELMRYILYLEQKSSQLEYLEMNPPYPAPFGPDLPRTSLPFGPDIPLPPLDQETEWKLDLSRERIVQDSTGMDGIPRADVGDVNDQTPQARPTGGPVLKKTREFNHQYQHTGTKLEIRSPLLVKALREAILAEAHNEYVTLHFDPVVFREPYMLLFHYWADIQKNVEDSDGDTKAHLEFLLSTLESECPLVGKVAQEITTNSLENISFQALWLVYRPGTTCFGLDDGHQRAYEVHAVSGCTMLPDNSFSPLKLTLRSYTVATTGKGFVQAYKTVIIEAFATEKNIKELDYVPAGYLPDEQAERARLIARGQRYIELTSKPQVMEYRGNKWNKTWEEDTMTVVIDTNMETAPPRPRDESAHDPLAPPMPYSYPRPFYALPGCNCARCTGQAGHSSSAPIAGCACALCTGSSSMHDLDTDQVQLYLPHDIYAFSLVRKTLEYVSIDELKEPEFEESMMDKKLVISPDHAEVVKSLVNSYTNGDLHFSDFVKGKGRGLVILLHGSPGTGKTLTAECVAEQAKRPLYAITCGDLGVDSIKLEGELRKIFDRATKWNAVLLLDEADVFLQERDIRNLERNALVSVFLRELEYFDGILFLTTNRSGQLDEAFQSRIHITLPMPSLDIKAQLKVWLTFLRDEVEADDIQTFLKAIRKETVKSPLNGRQIRNCVRSALSLAAQGREKLSVDHIRRVLNLTQQFSDYMKELQGHTGDERQLILGFRGK